LASLREILYFLARQAAKIAKVHCVITPRCGSLLKLKLATQCLLKLNPLAADSILFLHRQDAGLIGFPNGRWGVRYVELIIQVPDMGDHGVLRNRQCLGNLLAQ